MAIAQLLDHPNVTHELIAGLTDRQIIDHYNHPRDSEGRIVPVDREPPRPLTQEEADKQLIMMAYSMGGEPAARQAGEAIRKKREREEAEADGTGSPRTSEAER